MYLDYFALSRQPFRITPDPSLFVAGGKQGRGAILNALLYAVQSGEGFVKVVGEVGSGKTMLCRMLEEQLPANVESVYLGNPRLRPEDLLKAIAFELQLAIPENAGKLEITHTLQQYLLSQHAQDRQVLVIIEEAQGMPLETLEELRLFCNLETQRHKLMQVLLFGQPELEQNLRKRQIRQFRERITHSFTLPPLGREETAHYLRFRLHAAGCPSPQLFTPGAEKLIARASRGLTRRINILADKALLAAYADSAIPQQPACVDHLLQPLVEKRHVRAAIRDCGYRRGFGDWFRLAVASCLAASLLMQGPTQGRQVLQEASFLSIVSKQEFIL